MLPQLCQLCAGPHVNEARYITSDELYLCGTCDAQRSWASIKLTDVPQLLRVLDAVMHNQFAGNAYDQVKELVCLKKT